MSAAVVQVADEATWAASAHPTSGSEVLPGYGLLVFNYISTIFLHVMLEFVSK